MLVAVLSDIHSNLQALETVLAQLGSVDALWHLGDTVGYGPEPQAVVDRLREAGAIGVRGNHDDAAGGAESIELFNPDGYRAMEWTRTRINESARQYLAGLPDRIIPEGSDFTLAHGSPRDPIWEYLDSADIAQENLPAFKTPYCLVGHTHRPIAYREARSQMKPVAVGPGRRIALDDRRLILNPGSVGQPRDGDPRAGYLLADTDSGQVTWHRVEYDVPATQAAMRAAGLPAHLIGRLSLGW
jgi:predicted phosphodiesterase